MSPSSLCSPLPTLCCHDFSDLLSYQSVLFSVVGAALAIGSRPGLKPDPDNQTTALLHAIFLAINNSATPVITLAEEAPPSEEVASIIEFFYESSLASLLAAIFAISAKECLNGYLHLFINDSENRRRRFSALKGWGFTFLVRTSRILLQIAICFLLLGIGRRLFSLHPRLIYPLAVLVAPGLVSYLGAVFFM